jgi:hypothetical protein
MSSASNVHSPGQELDEEQDEERLLSLIVSTAKTATGAVLESTST